MERFVSATEARIRLGEWMRRAVEQGEIIIVQRAGRPYAVLMSFEAYQRRQGQKADLEDPLASLLALARRWAQERGGRPLTPPPEEVIRQMREERDAQLGLP